ncbi:MAG: sodium:calcium antiporter [Hyphomicrobiaceae bacterium]
MSFGELGLAANIGLFLVGGIIVWIAGTRLARYADQISLKTGIGQALLGLLFLGGVTSLPEVAVAVSSSMLGNTKLAVNNVLGGVTMQIAILAVADFVIGRRALTAVVPDPAVLLQGSLNIVLLAIAACGAIAGDALVGGVGLWSWLILAVFIVSIWLLSRADNRQPWIANIEETEVSTSQESEQDREDPGDIDLRVLIGRSTAASVAILAAGYLVARTGEAIAELSGLGQSFTGAAFVALTTSLPELSTVLAAVRLGLFTLAISDILGTNLFDVALIFVVDATSSGPPVLAEAGRFAAVASLLGILVTALFMVGLAERRDRTFMRLGIDSLAVVAVYGGGLVLLYALR